VLEKNGMVRSENKVYLKKYYRIPRGKSEDGFTLKSHHKKIIEEISSSPGLTAISVSKHLKIKHLVAIDRLRLLSEMGYIEPRHTSHGVRYYPGKKGVEDQEEGPKAIRD
jgi:predicted transcriptional regulator